MRIVFQQADLDTCLTALILGVASTTEASWVRFGASVTDLSDPDVLCIEAGGSGRVEEGNFDHHAAGGPTEPACLQALAARGGDATMKRLAAYVAGVDTAVGPIVAYPSIASVMSGIRLATSDSVAQFRSGVELLRVVAMEQLDPFESLPLRDEWAAYLEAYDTNRLALDTAASSATFAVARSGRRVGAVETRAIGAIGLLYRMGCEIAVACHPAFGEPPVRKITVAGNGVQVDALIAVLNQREPGWGGPAHGTIIASPRAGTDITVSDIIHLACEVL